MLSISKSAKVKLTNIIRTREETKALLLYLRGGGCNGFEYKFKELQDDRKPGKLDEVQKIDEFNLYICSKSLMYIIGSSCDYIEDIMGSRFIFNHSNIVGKCGCGTSVNFK